MELHHRSRQCCSSPAVANGVVYVGSFNEDGPQPLYALNAKTGALLWSYLLGLENVSSPAVANGVVYVGSTFGQRVRAERQHRRRAVELHHRRPSVVLARRGEWGGLCWLGGQQRVRAERQHRRPAVELRDGQLCVFLARRGQWGGLCRLGRRQRVRAERQDRRQAVELRHRQRHVFPRPPWRMEWSMSARPTATCTR